MYKLVFYYKVQKDDLKRIVKNPLIKATIAVLKLLKEKGVSGIPNDEAP